MTPDFPRSAELLTARWERDMGQHVDGVIATDPVAVSYLLGATGPVTEPGGLQIDASNVLQVLLRDAYLTYGDDAAAGDAFYTGVASTIFRAVGAGQGDSRAVVDALARAGAEGRLRMWSAHPEEQKKLAATSVGAAFLTGPFPDADGRVPQRRDRGQARLLPEHGGHRRGPALQRARTRPRRSGSTSATRRPPTSRPSRSTSPGWTRHGCPWAGSRRTSRCTRRWVPRSTRCGWDDGYVSGGTGEVAGRSVQVVTSLLEPGGARDVPVRRPGARRPGDGVDDADADQPRPGRRDLPGGLRTSASARNHPYMPMSNGRRAGPTMRPKCPISRQGRIMVRLVRGAVVALLAVLVAVAGAAAVLRGRRGPVARIPTISPYGCLSPSTPTAPPRCASSRSTRCRRSATRTSRTCAYNIAGGRLAEHDGDDHVAQPERRQRRLRRPAAVRARCCGRAPSSVPTARASTGPAGASCPTARGSRATSSTGCARTSR